MKSEASVMFSGGTDSTLAAVKMLEEHEKITLLTFDPAFIFFIENSKKHVQKLIDEYGADRVKHLIIKSGDTFKAIYLGNVKGDLKKYGPSLMAQLCHGCRLSMHTKAIIYNLENGIKYLGDGSIRKQSSIPEQMECIIAENRKFYNETYGIVAKSPIYENDTSDIELDEKGLSVKAKLKRQFIFFDTQATCPFGVPADVYGRIFYQKPFCQPEAESLVYNSEKHELMKQHIESYFNGKDKNLTDLIEHLRRIDN